MTDSDGRLARGVFRLQKLGASLLELENLASDMRATSIETPSSPALKGACGERESLTGCKGRSRSIRIPQQTRWLRAYASPANVHRAVLARPG